MEDHFFDLARPRPVAGSVELRGLSDPRWLINFFDSSTTMAAAICVRVVTENEHQGVHATSHWIVATGDPDKAVQAVRTRVSSRCQVRATTHRVSPETIRRMGLQPGQAHLL